jgi:hypothetical protein
VIALLALALDCASCHAAQASALANARHAVASELPVYRASAAKAGTRWCASCHRPAGEAAAGLVCTTCHVADGAVGDAGHAMQVTTRSCATCHEFATPLPDHLDPVVYSSQPLQSTASELAQHDAAAQCTSCHDPHRPTGAHDAALVGKAVRVAARSTADGVEVQVTVTGTGHRFPTGDPFRRLVITVCADASCEHVIGRQQISRSFALRGGVWAPVIDRSLADGETRTLAFPRGAFWRADLYYGDPRFEAGLPVTEVSLALASGPL